MEEVGEGGGREDEEQERRPQPGLVSPYHVHSPCLLGVLYSSDVWFQDF